MEFDETTWRASLDPDLMGELETATALRAQILHKGFRMVFAWCPNVSQVGESLVRPTWSDPVGIIARP